MKTYQLRYIKQIIFKKYYYSFRIMSGKNKTPKNQKGKEKNLYYRDEKKSHQFKLFEIKTKIN